MKNFPTSLLITLLFVFSINDISAQNIRPVRDDIGFCWNAGEMDSFINFLDINYGKEPNGAADKLIAGIVPHDDFLYSGAVSYPLFKLIRTKEVVIFGVTHGSVRRFVGDPQNVIILDNFDKWTGAYGEIEISPLREIIKSKLAPEYYIVNDTAQMLEHSIESLLPYIQHYNPSIKITPVMVTKTPFERMEKMSTQLSEIISEYITENNLTHGKDIFFLFSNDANHYGVDFDNTFYGTDRTAHTNATANDKRIANECFNGKITKNKIVQFTNELWPEQGVNKYHPLWCGKYPVTLGLLTVTSVIENATGKTISGNVIKYSDTFTEKVLPFKESNTGITAPFSLEHWVGFLSVGFYSD